MLQLQAMHVLYHTHKHDTCTHTHTHSNAQTHTFGENHFDWLEKLDNVAHLGVQVKTKSKTIN